MSLEENIDQFEQFDRQFDSTIDLMRYDSKNSIESQIYERVCDALFYPIWNIKNHVSLCLIYVPCHWNKLKQ